MIRNIKAASMFQSALCVCLLPLLAAQQAASPNLEPGGAHSANSPNTEAIPPTITVLVLNDFSGKPYEGIEVDYFCEDGHVWSPSQKTTTNASGLAKIAFPCASDVKFKVSTYIEGDELAECGEMEGQTLQKILETGVISDPRAAGGIWCPARISKRMKPVPGGVIIFLKKPTWWQVHVAG
ncbi:MAG: hypothetical protein ABR987_06840 [Terracidiphilus sp.]|jgi:hypothetical protein